MPLKGTLVLKQTEGLWAPSMVWKDGVVPLKGWEKNVAFMDEYEIRGIFRLDQTLYARRVKMSYFQLTDVQQESPEWKHFIGQFPRYFMKILNLSKEEEMHFNAASSAFLGRQDKVMQNIECDLYTFTTKYIISSLKSCKMHLAVVHLRR